MSQTHKATDRPALPGHPRPAAPVWKHTIKLPAAQTDHGKPLMQTLRERRSAREFAEAKLPLNVLSNLLWAAVGVNRAHSDRRTAPSAYEAHEIDVYVATGDGLYLYDALDHALKQVLNKDVRAQTGLQSFVADAPVNLVYVADHSKMIEADESLRELYSAADAGSVSQNVCLFCASEGLATVVRGMVDRPALGEVMKLRPTEKVILAQSVGYPSQKP